MNSFKRLAELKSIIKNLVLILYARGFTAKYGTWGATSSEDYHKGKSNTLDISKGLEDEAFTAELVKKINDARSEYSAIVNKIREEIKK